jgi:hypothetical protein
MTKSRFILTEADAPGIEVLYTPTPHEKPATQGTITEHTEENS